MALNSKSRAYKKSRKRGKRNEARNEEMKPLSFGKLTNLHAFLVKIAMQKRNAPEKRNHWSQDASK